MSFVRKHFGKEKLKFKKQIACTYMFGNNASYIRICIYNKINT